MLDGDAEMFEAHRDMMFGVAYRMLGTVADAEDAVQDAWLRWSAAPRHDVAQPRAYLTKIITNTSLNRLRSVRARREAYVGPWLPEPLLTKENPDMAERAVVAESVSLAMLVVLESLTPEERAVFVLREVFGVSYAEIGSALGRTDVSVRQIGHRAREHVQARRPRFTVDQGQQREVTRRFLDAADGGDIDGLIAVLAPDVTLTSDGGGLVRAARRPVTGADKVARLMAGLAARVRAQLYGSDPVYEVTQINGGPGLLITVGGRVFVAMAWEVVDGQVTVIHLINSPDKLAAISAGRTLPI
jgi:RNA polymerase sigma-70 factor (TIGR02957 family)